MDVFLLIVGLGLILAGANFLTDGAAALAQRLRIPEFVIGLTVVAIGTSTPELVVSTLSTLAGRSDLAIGNVVGSNLFNTLAILGICALIRPVPLTRENIRRDIPFGAATALLLLAMASDSLLASQAADRLGRADGVVMLALYLLLLILSVRSTPRPDVPADEEDRKPAALWLTLLLIAGGLGGLIFGGDLFLDKATSIARRLGVGDAVIAITLVAGGTSLPELAAAVVSLCKGKTEMALGNVIGSNIANILLILGLSATIRPLTLGSITHFDLIAVALSALLLLPAAFTFRRRAIDRAEGAILLTLYAAYIWHLLR